MKDAPRRGMRKAGIMQTKTRTDTARGPAEAAGRAPDEEEIAALAKRHRVSPAIVREIIRRSGATERAAIEREIEKGKARR